MRFLVKGITVKRFDPEQDVVPSTPELFATEIRTKACLINVEFYVSDVISTAKKSTEVRIPVCIGCPAWIRTMNNGSKGRCVTVTPQGKGRGITYAIAPISANRFPEICSGE